MTDLSINQTEQAAPAVASVRDYVALLKPRVMSLVVFTGFVGLVVAPGSIHPVTGLIALIAIYGLAIVIPSIALFVRRLHDINQTGWIYLGLVVASVIPVIGFIASIAMIVIACIPGTKGPNKYGPDPLNPGAGAADTFV